MPATKPNMKPPAMVSTLAPGNDRATASDIDAEIGQRRQGGIGLDEAGKARLVAAERLDGQKVMKVECVAEGKAQHDDQ